MTASRHKWVARVLWAAYTLASEAAPVGFGAHASNECRQILMQLHEGDAPGGK